MFLARNMDAGNGHPESEDEDDLEAPEAEDDSEDEDADADRSSDDEDEDEDEGTDEQDDEVEDEPTPNSKRVISDDDVVTVQIDGQDVEIPVKDLKRLAGQEKALTRKSEEASEMKRKSEEALGIYEASLNRQYKMALDAYKDYEGVNFLLLAKDENWSAAELDNAMRGEAQARANLEYFHQELQTHGQTVQAQRNKFFEDASNRCRQVLTDPVRGIKNWSDSYRNTLLDFAVQDCEVHPDNAVTLTDPASFKILDRLYRAERGQKALETKTSKPKLKPTKVIKSSSEVSHKVSSKSNAERAAMADLRRSGSIEDALRLAMLRSGND
ncbi:hypothetical protein ASG59_18735 [Methylobacterium sp. Leaf466]|nr:hypothetical protein ASG59_18735 [Methylobacterium sp. Leaf466]